MALINCSECGRQMSDTAKKCIHCGYKFPKTKKEKKPKNKKKIVLFVTIAVTLLLLGGAFCYFYFISPTTVPWCCKHILMDATCTESEECSRCGKIFGDPTGHDWSEATCIVDKTCKNCGKTLDDTKKPHNNTYATCTEASKCKDCGAINRLKLDHNVVDYECTRCNETFVYASDVKNILDITEIYHQMNSVGGIDQYMQFKNKSSTRTIKYITIELRFYNKVEDVLYDEVRLKNYASLKFTGPLAPGKTTDIVCSEACFYNSTYAGICNVQKITIEYTDGTILTLNDDIADEAVVAWR